MECAVKTVDVEEIFSFPDFFDLPWRYWQSEGYLFKFGFCLSPAATDKDGGDTLSAVFVAVARTLDYSWASIISSSDINHRLQQDTRFSKFNVSVLRALLEKTASDPDHGLQLNQEGGCLRVTLLVDIKMGQGNAYKPHMHWPIDLLPVSVPLRKNQVAGCEACSHRNGTTELLARTLLAPLVTLALPKPTEAARAAHTTAALAAVSTDGETAAERLLGFERMCSSIEALWCGNALPSMPSPFFPTLTRKPRRVLAPKSAAASSIRSVGRPIGRDIGGSDRANSVGADDSASAVDSSRSKPSISHSSASAVASSKDEPPSVEAVGPCAGAAKPSKKRKKLL